MAIQTLYPKDIAVICVQGGDTLVNVSGNTTYWKGLKVHLANEQITTSCDCTTAVSTRLSKNVGPDSRICPLYSGLLTTPGTEDFHLLSLLILSTSLM